MDRCFTRVLNVTRINDYRQLTEDHCDPPTGWKDCKLTSTVAYHPFKTWPEWERCLANVDKQARIGKLSESEREQQPHQRPQDDHDDVSAEDSSACAAHAGCSHLVGKDRKSVV